MPHISSMLPLPGVGELESVAKALIALLKGGYTNKGADLMKLLESITKWAGEMDSLAEFTTELHGIQKDLKAANKSKSRQRKLAIWDDLTSKLKQKIDCTTLSLTAQSHKALSKQALGLSRQHQIVKSYQIMDDVEVHTNIWPRPEYQMYYPTAVKPFRTTLRSGRFERVRVSYLTFAADSEGTVQKRVEEQMEGIRRLNHVNVAKFVGVTEGFSGLDGIVVAMDGINLNDFLTRTHSGAVWAKCIEGFEAFGGLAPECKRAERITVAPDGHVVVFPASSGGMDTKFRSYRYHSKRLDPGAALLMRIYADSYNILGPTRRRTFVDSLAKLGLGFTKIQVIKIAAECGMFPRVKASTHPNSSHLPGFQPDVGDFGWASNYTGDLVDWKSLGRSRHVQDTDSSRGSWSSGLEQCNSAAPDGTEWLTYVLYNMHPYLSWGTFTVNTILYTRRVDQPFRFDWKDIFAEAQEISERLEVDINDISFFWLAEFYITLIRPLDANWDEIPATLYYHWSSRTCDSHEANGFFGDHKTPDGGAWQSQLSGRGWKFGSSLFIRTFRMRDDWSYRYEQELKRIMRTTPGSFPGAQV